MLKHSGFAHKFIGNTKGREWFQVDLKTVKAAIAAVKEGRSVLAGGEAETDEPIEFREEQLAAVEKTLECFKKKDEMLWDAKMRFGKTLTALQVVRAAKGKFRRVIIVTHRPVVGGGWQEDFNKLFTKEDGYTFYRKESLAAGEYEFSGKVEAANDRKLAALGKTGRRFIYFASIQDLRGSQAVGGRFAKNRGVFGMDWDLVIVDEAHSSCVIGVLSSRDRVAALLGCKKEELGHLLQRCAADPVDPVLVEGDAPCQQVRHFA